MRRLLIGLAMSCLLPTTTFAAVSSEDLGRVISGLYDPLGGGATGDVTADGRATAADVPAAISGLRNPAWRGPRQVGFTHMVFTKNSETTGEPRPLDTYIWYPTDSDGTPNPRNGAIPEAPLSTEGGPYPLLMFSHGSCGTPLQSPFFTSQLASYGFIVASPPHPGNLFSDGLDKCRAPAALGDSFQNRPADIRFVIDSLLALNEDSESMFFGAIDAQRIGMSGHSFGGFTTIRVTAQEPRVLAGVALAPANIGLEDDLDSLAANPKPMQIQGAADDGTVPFPTNQQEPFDMLSPPRSLLKIFTVSDQLKPRSEGGGGTDPHLLFAQIFGSPSTIANIIPEQQQVLRFATPFILKHVAGDDQFDRFLAETATPANVEYTLDE